MNDPRWTEATFDRVIEAMGPTIETQGTWAEAATAILAALADAGLLVEPGSETREEWTTTLTLDDGGSWSGVESTARLWLDTDTRRWGKESRLVRRTVHVGPWREAS